MRIGFACCGDPDELRPIVSRYFPRVAAELLTSLLAKNLEAPIELYLQLPEHSARLSSNGLMHNTDIVALTYNTDAAWYPNGMPEQTADDLWSLAAALGVAIVAIGDEEPIEPQIARLRAA